MEVQEIIQAFKEVIEEKYLEELCNHIRRGKKGIVIDFRDVAKFNPELANHILDNLPEALKAFEYTIQEFDLEPKPAIFEAHFKNLPASQKINIRDLRSQEIGKFMILEGIVKTATTTKPRITIAKYECPLCGNIINVLQDRRQLKEPHMCKCGKKGKFSLLSKSMIDFQVLQLEESPEGMTSTTQTPRKVNIFLEGDLTNPALSRYTQPGRKIKVNGYIDEVPKYLRKPGEEDLVITEVIVKANYIELLEKDIEDIHINKEEEKQILEFSKDPDIYKKLINSIAPSIYGHEKLKEAIVYQLFEGVRKNKPDGTFVREKIHVLAIGDPSSGKTKLLNSVQFIAPKSRYVVGGAATRAGITASIIKDELSGAFALEAGAVVLANNGIALVDEIDKMNDEERAGMHEAMESLTITKAGAGIHTQLPAETTILAAANPKFARFDPYDTVSSQINMPPSLLTRFDAIFPIKDIPSKETDKQMARHILKSHQDPTFHKPEIDPEFFRKYIIYAKQHCKPDLTQEAADQIESFYVNLRNRPTTESDREIKSVPVSPRQLEALVRFSSASAKIRLSPKVTLEDTTRAINLMEYCLQELGMDKETGQLDIDKIESTILASQRSKFMTFKEILRNLEKQIEPVPIEYVLTKMEEKGCTKEEFEEIVEKLKRSGDIYEPRPSFLKSL